MKERRDASEKYARELAEGQTHCSKSICGQSKGLSLFPCPLPSSPSPHLSLCQAP
jgi:hypothetical protein